jgi:hypothetical protein
VAGGASGSARRGSHLGHRRGECASCGNKTLGKASVLRPAKNLDVGFGDRENLRKGKNLEPNFTEALENKHVFDRAQIDAYRLPLVFDCPGYRNRGMGSHGFPPCCGPTVSPDMASADAIETK